MNVFVLISGQDQIVTMVGVIACIYVILKEEDKKDCLKCEYFGKSNIVAKTYICMKSKYQFLLRII